MECFYLIEDVVVLELLPMWLQAFRVSQVTCPTAVMKGTLVSLASQKLRGQQANNRSAEGPTRREVRRIMACLSLTPLPFRRGGGHMSLSNMRNADEPSVRAPCLKLVSHRESASVPVQDGSLRP